MNATETEVLRLALARLLAGPLLLTDEDLVALATASPRWRDRALEQRAVARQQQDAPAKGAGAMQVFLAERFTDIAMVLATTAATLAALREEVRAQASVITSLRQDLTALSKMVLEPDRAAAAGVPDAAE